MFSKQFQNAIICNMISIVNMSTLNDIILTKCFRWKFINLYILLYFLKNYRLQWSLDLPSDDNHLQMPNIMYTRQKKKYKNDAMLLFKTASKSSLLQSKCILKPLFSINLNLFAFAMGNGAWGKDLWNNNRAGSGWKGCKVKSVHCYAWPN